MPVFPPSSLSPSGDVLYQEAFAYASTSALRSSAKYGNWRDSSQASLDTTRTDNSHNTGKLHESTGYIWAGPNLVFVAKNHTVARRRCYYPAGFNFRLAEFLVNYYATAGGGSNNYGLFIYDDGVRGPHYYFRTNSYTSGGSNLSYGVDADQDLGACGAEITTGGVWFDVFYEHDHSHVNDVSSPHVFQSAWISINRGAAMLLGTRTQPLSSPWAGSTMGTVWPLGVPDNSSGSPQATQDNWTSEAEIVDLAAHADYYGLSGANPTYTPYATGIAATGTAGQQEGASGSAGESIAATGSAGSAAGASGAAGEKVSATGSAGEQEGASGNASEQIAATGSAGEQESASGAAGEAIAATGSAGEAEGAAGNAGESIAATGSAGQEEGAEGTAGSSGGSSIFGSAGQEEGAQGSAGESIPATGAAGQEESAQGTAGERIAATGSGASAAGASGNAGERIAATGSGAEQESAAGSAGESIAATGSAGEVESAHGTAGQTLPGAPKVLRAVVILRDRYVARTFVSSKYRATIIIN